MKPFRKRFVERGSDRMSLHEKISGVTLFLSTSWMKMADIVSSAKDLLTIDNALSIETEIISKLAILVKEVDGLNDGRMEVDSGLNDRLEENVLHTVNNGINPVLKRRYNAIYKKSPPTVCVMVCKA